MSNLSEISGCLNVTGVVTGPPGEIGATGPAGATGPQGPAGESAPVYYGTGDPPSASGKAEGSLYFKYTA